MPTITIDQFGGIAPRIHPTLLAEGMAQTAHNCVLKSGKLVPLRQPAKTKIPVRFASPGMAKPSEARTIHVWKSGSGPSILAWNGFVRVAPGNFNDDNYHRLFVTGDTGVGLDGTEPAVYLEEAGSLRKRSLYKEALPAPEVTRASGPIQDEGDDDNIRYTAFEQSWVDYTGYESPPSMPGDGLEYYDGDLVRVSQIDEAPAGAALRRIYKVVSGTQGGTLRFVAQQEAVSGRFPTLEFAMNDDMAGEEIPAIVSPPADLRWMTFVPGGFYAGFSESRTHEVRFSEVGAPVSWPEAYGVSVEDSLVGIGVTLNNVFAITDGHPYSITGSSPDAMTATRIATEQGCVSARSICTLDGSVYYVSQDGVCRLRDGAGSVELLTEGWFSKREWAELDPGTARMVAYDRALFLWFGWSPVKKGMIVAPSDGGCAVTTHDVFAYAAAADAGLDKLFIVGE